MLKRSFPSLLRTTGLLIWLGLSAATLIQAAWGPRLAAWAVASLAFAVAFTRSVSREQPAPAELAVQGIGITAMVGLLCNGFEGLLLVLMAAQLGYWTRIRHPVIWIVVAAGALFAAVALHWSLRPAILLAPPYLGFSILMFVGARLLREEAETRAHLAEANRMLQQAQATQARTARLDERLRIMQGLHDSLGHHLTALNINLEVAAHKSPGAEAIAAIRTAQDLARVSLMEIRSLVQEAREETQIDLVHELRQLAQDLPRPRLHVTCASTLAGLDPEIARALLQSVQEVTTNSIRHGAASNLWIEIARSDGHVELLARDDGHGAGDIRAGFGLTGIQRRVQALGGKMSLGSGMGRGFEVRLELPCEALPQS
jgi:signal transduction histidine kinase